ncbi:MAG: hypothetical protein QM723_33935 [Myxococcaceae bacterium]
MVTAVALALVVSAGPLAEQPDLSTMTYPQLSAEYDRLAASRPNLVGPIVLVSGSEVGFAMAADLLYTGIGVGFGTTAGTGVAAGSDAGWLLVSIGAVLFVASALIGIYGTVRLYDVIRRRFVLGAQMDEVRTRMTDPSLSPAASTGGMALLSW